MIKKLSLLFSLDGGDLCVGFVVDDCSFDFQTGSAYLCTEHAKTINAVENAVILRSDMSVVTRIVVTTEDLQLQSKRKVRLQDDIF